jgi:hypothetical protein
MRYFSARRIGPAAVDEAAVEAYMQYRARTTALVADDGARRAIARAWNGCIDVIEGWPERRLMEPTIKATEGPNWEKFPDGLRREIEAYVNGLARSGATPGATGSGLVSHPPSERAEPSS